MEQARTLKLIWFSFMTSIALFQVVLFLADSEPTMELVQALVVAAMGIGPALFGLVGVPRVLAHNPAQTAWIIRFACFESVALFGFVAGFTSGVAAISLAAAVASWGLLVATFPTDERFTAWEVRRLGDG